MEDYVRGEWMPLKGILMDREIWKACVAEW